MSQAHKNEMKLGVKISVKISHVEKHLQKVRNKVRMKTTLGYPPTKHGEKERQGRLLGP